MGVSLDYRRARVRPSTGAAMLGRGRVPDDAVVAQPDEGLVATKYDAFISYSHAADAELAKNLQDALRRLAKPWYGRRALHVFRDATGLSVSPGLWTSICDALDSSRYFVLMASPASAASEWVGRELGRWLEQRPAERILIVLTDGETEWLDAPGDFDWERSTAVHPVLRGAFSEEPLYLDLRWAREEPDLSVRNPRFRGEVAELAAPIHGRPREDLESEDLREQRKLRRAARGGVSILVLLLVLAVVTTIIAFQQRSEARHAVAVSQARALSAEALNQLQAGRNGLALLLAVEGNRISEGSPTRSALLRALEGAPGLYRDLATGSGTVGAAAFSSDNTLVAAADGNTIRIWNVASGRRLPHAIKVASTRGVGRLVFADGDRLLVAAEFAAEKNLIEVWDARTGAPLGSSALDATYFLDWGTNVTTVRLAAVEDVHGDADVFDLRTGQLVQRLPAVAPYDIDNPTSLKVALSPDGREIAVAQIRAATTGGSQYVETVDAWNVDSGQRLGVECRGPVGGPFDGRFRMYPDVPQVLETVVGSNAQSVTTLTSGGTRAVLGTCNLASGTLSVTTVQVPTQATAPVAGISPDGTLVATRDSLTGAVSVFDASSSPDSTPAEVRSGVVEPPLASYEFGSVAFSPDGRLMAIPMDSVGELQIWRTRRDEDPLAHGLRVPSSDRVLSLSPSTTSLLVETPSGGRQVLDRATGHTLRPRLPSTDVFLQRCTFLFGSEVQFVGRGDRLAAPVQDQNCETPTVALWDVRSGARRDITIPGRACAFELKSIGLSFDARTLVVGCTVRSSSSSRPQRTVARIDISSRRARVLSVDRVDLSPDSLTVSPDGRTVVAAEGDRGGGGFQALTLVNGHMVRGAFDSANGNFIGAAAFAPDGHAFATGFSDGRLRLWTLGSRGPRAVDLAETGPQDVTALAFSPDNSELVVGDSDGGVRIWDLSTTSLVGAIAQRPRSVDGLGFMSDGKSVIAISAAEVYNPNGNAFPGSMVSLSVDVPAWVRSACAIVNRNLTSSEWNQFVPSASYHRTCPTSR
jgi:WD40 repeat protein